MALEVLFLLLLLLGHVLVIVHRGQTRTLTEKKPGDDRNKLEDTPLKSVFFMISLGNLGEGKGPTNQELHRSGGESAALIPQIQSVPLANPIPGRC